MHLSVIIPAYNEEQEITSTLNAVFNYLLKQTYDWEIIVLNDGSKDKTAEKAADFAAQHHGVTVVDNHKNHGKGYVVREGMLGACGDFRLFTDADNSTSIEQIEKFWPYLFENYDIVIGSIEIPGAEIHEHAQWYRRFLGRWSKLLTRIVTGLWEIHDTQRGFKCFKAQAAQDIFSRAIINRFGFDIEILMLAKKLGYKIKEAPVVWINPAESSVTLKSYFQVLKDLFKIRFRIWFNAYQIKEKN